MMASFFYGTKREIDQASLADCVESFSTRTRSGRWRIDLRGERVVAASRSKAGNRDVRLPVRYIALSVLCRDFHFSNGTDQTVRR